jgi:hypothetical protein
MVHYAQSWEDPNLLWEVWQRSCPDHVHMVASGGDHALELLQKGLPAVHAYDTEANQLQHIHAKLDALHHAQRDQLFGYGSARRSKGLLHDGKLEGYLRIFSQRVLPWMILGRHREGLAQQTSPADQVNYLRQHWTSWMWRRSISMLFSPKNVDKNARHQGLVDTEGRQKLPPTYYASFERILGQTRLSDNPYLDYLLYGRHAHSVLPYLEDASFTPQGRLHLHQEPLQAALAILKPEKRFIHASDILESYPEPQIPGFFRAVDQACTSGSSFVFWDHRYATPIPAFFQEGWTRLDIQASDRVPFYHSFHAFQKL